MKLQVIRAGWWGMLVSFLGSLPLGTQNVVATSISIHDGAQQATFFSFGSLLIELICVRIALMLINRISKQIKLFIVFKWITALLLLALAFGSFMAAIEMKSFGDTIFTGYHIHPFLLGMLLSTLNPLHIPFWLGWSNVLMDKNILTSAKQFPAYMLGIGTGTILGFQVFIVGGNYVIQQLSNHQSAINWGIGIVLCITAMVEIYKLIYKAPVAEASLA